MDKNSPVQLSQELYSKLENIFQVLYEGENNVELSRRVICSREDFEPYLLFKYLDVFNTGFISYNELNDYLKKKGLSISKKDINYIISFYDSDYDGKLSYIEFTYLIQSSSYIINYKINRLYDTLDRKSIEDFIPKETDFAFQKILEKEIELAQRLIELTREMRTIKDFNMQTIFKFLKSDIYITYDSLSKFIKNSLNLSKENADIRRVCKRFDLKNDGSIDIYELSKLFITYDNEEKVEENSYIPYFDEINVSSNISEVEEDLFINYIKQMIKFEMQMEKYKIRLADVPEFNIVTLYRKFDDRNKGYITQDEFFETLNRFGVPISTGQLIVIFHEYDRKNKEYLSYDDFVNMILPFNDEIKNEVLSRKNIGENIELSTKLSFNDLIKQLIFIQTKINFLKFDLMRIRLKLKSIYYDIEREGKGYISFSNWEAYLDRLGICQTKDEYYGKELSFRRIDKEDKGNIKYSDLLNEIMPVY